MTRLVREEFSPTRIFLLVPSSDSKVGRAPELLQVYLTLTTTSKASKHPYLSVIYGEDPTGITAERWYHGSISHFYPVGSPAPSHIRDG